MTQTRNFNFVFRLVDDLDDGDLLYYFYHKFERNKDVNFDDLKIFLDRFHDDDVDEEYYKEEEKYLIEAWNDESYNKDKDWRLEEYFNEFYEANFDINEVEY